MFRRTVTAIMLTLLLTSMLILAFNIQLVEADGTIYIRADGSIDPPTAPIERNGDVYTFTADIYDQLSVEKDSIVVDGANHALKGTGGGTWCGIFLSCRKWVTIKNVQIKNFSYGILLSSSLYNNISGNDITSNVDGISFVDGSSNNSIARNTVGNNNGFGLIIDNSSCNSIQGNIVTKSIMKGIWLRDCLNNNIFENTVTDNGEAGLFLSESDSNDVWGNTVEDNSARDARVDAGIVIAGSSYNSIHGNTVRRNSLGILLCQGADYHPSANNSVTDNTVTNNNGNGICISESSYNSIRRNTVAGNPTGISIGLSLKNVICQNNFINNTLQAPNTEFENLWDDGYPSGGNYWSDYAGIDANADGIGDTPYVIDENNLDHYPLMSARGIDCGWPVLVSPVQISSNGGYNVGDTLTARFTIQNQGTAAIHLDKLLFGGRFNGGTLPSGGFPDFSYNSVTLQVGQTYQYEGTLYLTEAGHYQFFVAYYIANPTEAERVRCALDPNNWNTCIDLTPGLSDCHRTWDRSVPDWTPLPQTIPIAGKGIWIWRLTEAEGGNIDAIMERLRSVNVDWIAVKCAEGSGTIASDGYDYSSQWTPSVISQVRSAGLRFLGWQYVYGDDPIGEANIANRILDAGVDGFVIDAEGEYEGKPDSAVTYMNTMREEHPDAFIAYAPFPIIDGHTSFPYLEFGKGCDSVMPQVYWKEIGVTPERMIDWMEEQWNKWHKTWKASGHGDSVKPIMPLGQGWAVSGDEITRFCDLVYNHEYDSVSLWRYDTMTEENWQAYANCFNPDTTIRGQCPIDLVVTDPDGLIINKTLNQIPGALYMESDPNGIDDTVIEVSILRKKLGDYFIAVVPRLNASMNATYSLDFATLNTTTTLAQNVSISDIPSKSYAVTLTETTIVPRTAAHDVGIDRFSALKTIIGQGQIAGIDVKVRNYGDDVEHFNLTLYLNSSMIASLENITFASRDSFLTTFRWNTTGSPLGNYTINAYAEPVLNETYVADNNVTLTVHVGVPGDITGPTVGVYDGTANMRDIQYLILLFNTNPSSPNWKPNADVNNDGTVNMRDIQIAILNFNQHE